MITVTLLTKNSAQTLQNTLESVKDFPEVLVYDTGSTDQTLEIAASFPNVRILLREFIGFGKTHNLASNEARFDWILSLDSDEVLTPSLSKEILSLCLDLKTVYAIRRKNYFNGKWIRGCSGWDPDWVVRLYNRTQTSFTNDPVHEKIQTQSCKVIRLCHPMTHTPYQKISDFLLKMQVYSELFAQIEHPSSLTKALFHSLFAFFKSYILKKGFVCGKEGLIISLYNSHTTFYKHLKRAERR